MLGRRAVAFVIYPIGIIPVNDPPQRVQGGDFLKNPILILDLQHTMMFSQFTENLNHLDGIETEIAFQVRVKIEHVLRIARAFAHRGQQVRFEFFGAGDGLKVCVIAFGGKR